MQKSHSINQCMQKSLFHQIIIAHLTYFQKDNIIKFFFADKLNLTYYVEL